MSLPLPERTYARRLTPDEVVALSRGEHVSHLRDDPVVVALRRSALGSHGDLLFQQARTAGYLILLDGAHLREVNGRLALVWGWWCAAARRPHATIDLRPRPDGRLPRVRVDLSPTGRAFVPAVMGPIGRVCAVEIPGDGSAWIATPDVVEADVPSLDGATGILLTVLALAREERWLAPRPLGPPAGA